MCLVLVAAFCPALLLAQNSTRKVRKAPGELAARAGSAVQWRPSVDAALAEAKESGKPVFWYVPSVHRSPMDRKPEVDRYMMGGPFSWPSTVVLLNQHFVPVREVARGERAKQLGLERGAFIEPGYLVLAGDGTAKLKVQQVTTFHPEVFLAPLRRIVGQPSPKFEFGGVRPQTAAAVQRGDWQQVLELVAQPSDELVSPTPKDGLFAEQHWLRGVALFRLGRRQDAVDAWRRLMRSYPDHPLGQKAALEVEGHGPFVRGFEVYCDLPAAASATDPHDGTRAPEGL
ncbi:MAG: thioredoxin family protein, partial [Planctomycetes bacterium]|nr:thioredoxin family protein [Planctomycetota bacterium]